VSLDSSVIDLCLSLFDWAKFRRTKGAVKLHLLLDHDGYLPAFAVITDGKCADVRVARDLQFQPGTIVVMDRGYVDFRWFAQLTARGVFFVTRPKEGMVIDVVEERAVPERGNIINDEVIELGTEHAKRDCPHRLRRVTVLREDTLEPMEILTNNFQLAASTIAAIYKDRWQIELFFKAIKQNLRIKTFVGTSANAVKVQIWTALIAMLILKYLQLRSTFAWSLSNLVALLRMNLFVHRDLFAWINEPFGDPPDLPQETSQLSLEFAA
jgi:IS4 transposase